MTKSLKVPKERCEAVIKALLNTPPMPASGYTAQAGIEGEAEGTRLVLGHPPIQHEVLKGLEHFLVCISRLRAAGFLVLSFSFK